MHRNNRYSFTALLNVFGWLLRGGVVHNQCGHELPAVRGMRVGPAVQDRRLLRNDRHDLLRLHGVWDRLLLLVCVYPIRRRCLRSVHCVMPSGPVSQWLLLRDLEQRVCGLHIDMPRWAVHDGRLHSHE